MDIEKRYRLVVIGLIVMVILNIFVLGSLWLFRPPVPPRHSSSAALEDRHGIQRILDRRLDLTEKQRKKFKELRDDYHAQIKSTLEEIRKNRQELYEVIDTADSVQTDSLTSRIAREHKKIEMINVHHFRELRSILDVPQQKKFDKMLRRVINLSVRRPKPPAAPR